MAELSLKALDRLRDARKYSYDQLEVFRQNQVLAIKEYVGKHYSKNGAADKVPVNFLELAITIYLEQLAANNPQVLVTTAPDELKSIAYALQVDTNFTLHKLHYQKALYRIVNQALFSVGIGKCGLATAGQVEAYGQVLAMTHPFFDSVSLDNWVQDMTASSWEGMQFCGDRYAVDYEQIMDSPDFSDEFKKKLVPISNISGDKQQGRKSKSVSAGQGGGGSQRYRDIVYLWDIWLPHEKLVVVMADDDFSEAGRVIEWQGPDQGPYRMLSFAEVPDNVMPLPPVATWIDLHDLANRLFRKVGRQADRQKTITAVQAGADPDGNRILNASDGDMIKVDNPSAVKEFSYGGVDAKTLAFLIQVKDLAAYFYGNLDALGGLGKSSDTLGQDEMITSNASKKLASMQRRVLEFVTETTRDIAWYRWTEPLKLDYPIVKEKYGIQVPTVLSAKDRETDFFMYNFNVEPYSLQHQTPQSRAQALTSIFTNFVAPFAPMFMQQGIMIDFERLFRTLSDYTNLPELRDILIFTNPQQPDLGPLGESQRLGGGMPAQTTRRYVRENRPGATRSGKDAVMMQTLLGGASQPDEMAAMNKSVA